MTSAEAGPAEREALARSALDEFTRSGDVGPLLDEVPEDGVWALHFAATAAGYPGWRWEVSLAQLEGADPTVLEAELLPGDGALLAPDWVPWSTRLEEWRAQQTASGESVPEPGEDATDAGSDEDDDLDEDEDEDNEDDDLDDEDSADEDSYEDDDDEDSDEDDDLGHDVYDGLDPEAAAGLDDEDDDR